jgi:hypothetical protein
MIKELNCIVISKYSYILNLKMRNIGTVLQVEITELICFVF